MTKSELNKALKTIYLGFIKAIDDPYAFTTKKISNQKGVHAGQIGPMSATVDYNDVNNNVKKEIIKKCSELGMKLTEDDDDRFVMEATNDGKKPLKALFVLTLFPAYTGSANLDPNYKDYWWVLSYA